MANNAENTTPTLPHGKGFLHEVMTELKKTTWPPFPEAWRLTMVVLGVIICVAIYIGIIDMSLSWLTKRFGLIK